MSEKLNRKLSLCFVSGVYLDFDSFNYVPSFTFAQYVCIEKHDPMNGYFLGTSEDIDVILNYCNNIHYDKTIFIEMYFENIGNILKHNEYVKYIYQPKLKLIQNNNVIIHMRIGDLEYTYDKAYPIFTSFCHNTICDLYRQYNVIIVTEDIDNIHVEILRHLLTSNNINVKIESKNVNEDFKTIQEAKVIFCTDSTFSWWAHYLNPFKPIVYFCLSQKYFPNLNSRNTLFSAYNVFNIDKNKLERKYIL